MSTERIDDLGPRVVMRPVRTVPLNEIVVVEVLGADLERYKQIAGSAAWAERFASFAGATAVSCFLAVGSVDPNKVGWKTGYQVVATTSLLLCAVCVLWAWRSTRSRNEIEGKILHGKSLRPVGDPISRMGRA